MLDVAICIIIYLIKWSGILELDQFPQLQDSSSPLQI